MSSLLDLFQSVITDKGLWDYYGGMYNYYDSIDNILADSGNFIREYLSFGDKMSNALPNKYFHILENNNMRATHTVSIFLLGLYLYKNLPKLKAHIDEFIDVNEANTDSIKDTPFTYYWFLVCFFHDMAYSFEELEYKSFFRHLDGINKKFIVNGLPYRCFVYSNRNENKNHKSSIIPRNIINSWRKYFIFRYIENGKIDHGIIGGLLFYTDRYDQYNKKKNEFGKESFTDYNGLFWSKEILHDIHLPIAWTILAHNMWFIPYNSGNKEKYEEFDMKNLIIRTPVINIEKYPLLYLLSLVDTIDPLKEGIKKGCNVDEVIKKTSLRVEKDTIIFDNYYNYLDNINKNGIAELKEWLHVNVTSNNNELKINIL